MKKYIALIAVFIMIMISISAVVMADDMRPKAVDIVLAEIRQELGLYTTDAINLNKVSSEKLEELGDSVMEAMIGNPQIHDQMDINLGGDGSASLTAFHRKLGTNYLSGYPDGMMNLMSSGMMSKYQGGMMSYFENGSTFSTFGWGGLVMGLLLLVSLIFNVILSIRIGRKRQA